MLNVVDDASSEARYKHRGLRGLRGLRGFVDLGDKVGVGPQSADRGLMELATEAVVEVVTAERACSGRDRYLQRARL